MARGRPGRATNRDREVVAELVADQSLTHPDRQAGRPEVPETGGRAIDQGEGANRLAREPELLGDLERDQPASRPAPQVIRSLGLLGPDVADIPRGLALDRVRPGRPIEVDQRLEAEQGPIGLEAAGQVPVGKCRVARCDQEEGRAGAAGLQADQRGPRRARFRPVSPCGPRQVGRADRPCRLVSAVDPGGTRTRPEAVRSAETRRGSGVARHHSAAWTRLGQRRRRATAPRPDPRGRSRRPAGLRHDGRERTRHPPA